MADLVSSLALTAWRNFLQAHAAAVGRIEADLEERGLISLEWYDLLVAIQFSPDRQLRMMDLAEMLLLTRSNATRLVDRLEALGLIRRERLDGDGRGTVVVLTAAGRQALRRAWPTYAKGINDYFGSALSAADLRAVASAMETVEQRARLAKPAIGRRTLR